jgi:hypothetical protein
VTTADVARVPVPLAVVGRRLRLAVAEVRDRRRPQDVDDTHGRRRRFAADATKLFDRFFSKTFHFFRNALTD